MSATQLKDIIDQAPEAENEPPRPLQRPLEPADPFPVEALGTILGDAALAIVDKVQCPEAIAGQSILAAATLAIQGHADIELPQGSIAPLSIFFLTVAWSGERKSTAVRSALRPVHQREKTLRAQYEHAMPAYAIRQASWHDPELAQPHPGRRPGAGASVRAVPGAWPWPELAVEMIR